MGWEAWFTLAVVALVFLGMVRDVGPPDMLLLGGTLALALAGVIKPEEAFAGFANEAMLVVAALFVVVGGLRETGALDALGARMLGRASTARGALGRMALWINTALLFLTNTSIVAMLLPVVTEWCRKHKISPSRLLIPLSFFTVLRGTVTLIGTSTNLVVSGLLLQASLTHPLGDRLHHALRPVSFFEITPVGVPIAVLGTLYLLFIGSRLLPDRKDLLEQLDETSREYLVDLRVEPGCRLVGRTVEEGGLRHLPGLFLVELRRGEHSLSPVGPDDVIEAGDRLTFTGVVSSIVDLERIPGLVPAVDEEYQEAGDHRTRRLSEAVISPTSPLIGRTIRDANFRTHYNAAIIAVHRGGERLSGRLGDIVLREGDTLLLQTGAHFARVHRNNADFILVSSVEDARPVRHERARTALTILTGVILLMAFGGQKFTLAGMHFRVPEIVVIAFLGAILMVATRCISASEARQSLNWQTLLSIAAAFGLGKALQNSGAAEVIANMVVRNTAQWGGPLGVLAACYLVTMVLTELLSNAAAAAIMFPFALSMANEMGVSPRPFAISIMFAASLAFATPVGYQTNLMVYGPGGYKFSDFTRVGLPLNLLVWLLSVLLIPLFWPFHRF